MNEQERETSELPFEIISVCKDDLRHFMAEEDVDLLTSDDIKIIANKLADDYCEQLFWDSLKIISENILEQKKQQLNKLYNGRKKIIKHQLEKITIRVILDISKGLFEVINKSAYSLKIKLTKLDYELMLWIANIDYYIGMYEADCPSLSNQDNSINYGITFRCYSNKVDDVETNEYYSLLIKGLAPYVSNNTEEIERLELELEALKHQQALIQVNENIY